MSKKIDLSKVYIDDETRQAVLQALDSSKYILGENVKKFEENFAKFCGTKYAVCVSSGTAAIFLTLLSLGIKKGDEVIVPSFTALPTVSPILHVGATPVFVDIDLETYTIDPNKIENKITGKTKCILPVHLYGHPADLDSIKELANKNNLILFEDCCQAHGAKYKGETVGGISDVGCFSFYPSKNLTVCGDGGMVVTNNEELATKVRMLRDHGRKEKYVHELLGFNLRFNEIQAAIGLRQLEKLPWFNEKRREHAKIYSELLKGSPLVIPIERDWAYHVYHLYVVRTEKRDPLAKWLNERGIQTGIHYPIPVHLQPAVKNIIPPPPDLGLTEKCANQVLSLPMHPQQTMDELKYVAQALKDFFSKTS